MNQWMAILRVLVQFNISEMLTKFHREIFSLNYRRTQDSRSNLVKLKNLPIITRSFHIFFWTSLTRSLKFYFLLSNWWSQTKYLMISNLQSALEGFDGSLSLNTEASLCSAGSFICIFCVSVKVLWRFFWSKYREFCV